MNEAQRHLQGKVAVVTGGATGLGLAITRCLVSAGAKVAVVASRAPELVADTLAEFGGKAVYYQFNITDTDHAQELADKITTDYKFFAKDVVPAGTYEGQEGDVNTISVGAQWITSADQPEELIYGITKALWNDNTRKQLDAGHAKGKVIVKEHALDGLGLPLHPGAERFYKEAGLLK